MNATEARGAVTGLQIALRTQPNSFVARLVTSEHNYSAVPNKRTGTFIVLNPKFPLVRSFFSGTLIK